MALKTSTLFELPSYHSILQNIQATFGDQIDGTEIVKKKLSVYSPILIVNNKQLLYFN